MTSTAFPTDRRRKSSVSTLLNKELYVIATLRFEEKKMMGIVPVPQFISDVIYLPGHDIRYIRMEK